jgi:ribonuclease HI
LNIETHLLPVEEQILKHNIDTLGRIGPAERPPFESTNSRRKRKSPRQAIEQTIRDLEGPNIRHQEQASPYVTPPWWCGPKHYIESTAKAAKQKHLEQLSDHTAIHIYTDGSGVNGHVGAAAVCTTTQDNRAAYMGTEQISTVYAAELQGILLALQTAREDKQRGNTRSKVCIYTDNQAAISFSSKPKGKPGAYLLKAIAQITEELQQSGLPVEIRWIPAHTGIWGNEQADKAAKEATGWREGGATGPRAAEPAELWALRSTLKTWTHKHVHKAWQDKWANESRGRVCFRYTPKPTKKVLQLHTKLNKRQSALLIGLRTEKIATKHFLFKQRVPGVTDDRCPCGQGRQTVLHILLRCRQHRQLRDRELGGIPGLSDLRKVLGERKAAAKAIRFMEQAGTLGHFGVET